MRYYHLLHTEEFFGGTHGRTTSGEGIALSAEQEGVYIGNVERISIVVPDDDEDPPVTSSEDLPDHVFVFELPGFVFSLKAKSIVEDLHPVDSMESTPVDIKNREENFLDTYYLLWSLQFIDVLDREKSELSRPSERVIFYWEVKKWVLDADRIPPYDLFYSNHGCWIATETLKDRFEQNEVTNCRFDFLAEA